MTTKGDESFVGVKSCLSHNNFLQKLASASSFDATTMRFGQNFVGQQNTSGNSSTVERNIEKSELEEEKSFKHSELTTTNVAVVDPLPMEPTKFIRSADIMCLDLTDRYVSLENNFNDYRRKTTNLLLKKDAHISRLQERLNSFVENSNADATMHTLVAERDAVRLKLQQLEVAYNEEKSYWMSEVGNLRRRAEINDSAANKEEKEHVSQCRIHQTQNVGTMTFLDETKKCDCDFLSKELERCQCESSELKLKMENLIAQHNKQTDSIRKQFTDELTNKTDELNQLRDKLTATIIEKEELMKNFEKLKLDLHPVEDDANCRLSAENQLLKRELYETKEYFESLEVESEQQISVLANQIDEMHEILENKQRDYVVLTNELLGKKQESESLQQKLKASENQTGRQQDVIESLRDDFDKQKDKFRETMKERDELLIRNASLTHEVDFTKRQSQKEREDILQQLTLAGQELDEYKEKLRSRENETDDSSTVLTNLTSKVSDLEETLRHKQETVDSLEQRLANVKKLLRKNLMLKSSKSEYDLNVGKKFRPNVENQAENVMNRFLRLSTDEEQLVRNFLQQKSVSQYLPVQ